MATYQKAVKKREMADFDVLANLNSSSSPASPLFSLDTPRNLARQELHPAIKYGFYLDGVLTREECEYLIRETDDKYSSWLSDAGAAKENDEEAARLNFRNCDTIEVQNARLRDFLFEIIASGMLPEEKDCVIDEDDVERYQRDLRGRWVAASTVRTILFSRYLHGGHFSAHTDGFNIENFDRRSLYSIVIYLNDVEKGGGGETTFYSDECRTNLKPDEKGRIVGDERYKLVSVEPVAGRAVVFFHNVMHQSEPIRNEGGKKYIIRSDVIYERNPKVLVSPSDLEAYEIYRRAEEAAEDPNGGAEESARLYRTAFKASKILADIYGC